MANLKDVNEFTQAVLQIQSQAYKVAYCYLHNEQDSKDMVGNAVEKAYLNIRKLKDCNLFNTWFIRILINECKMFLRKKKRVVSISGEFYPALPNATFVNDDKIDLETVLDSLNSFDRTLIHMKYYLGYTLCEIAYIMEIPEGTVKTKIYNNLKVLKERLDLKEV